MGTICHRKHKSQVCMDSCIKGITWLTGPRIHNYSAQYKVITKPFIKNFKTLKTSKDKSKNKEKKNKCQRFRSGFPKLGGAFSFVTPLVTSGPAYQRLLLDGPKYFQRRR